MLKLFFLFTFVQSFVYFVTVKEKYFSSIYSGEKRMKNDGLRDVQLKGKIDLTDQRYRRVCRERFNSTGKFSHLTCIFFFILPHVLNCKWKMRKNEKKSFFFISVNTLLMNVLRFYSFNYQHSYQHAFFLTGWNFIQNINLFLLYFRFLRFFEIYKRNARYFLYHFLHIFSKFYAGALFSSIYFKRYKIYLKKYRKYNYYTHLSTISDFFKIIDVYCYLVVLLCSIKHSNVLFYSLKSELFLLMEQRLYTFNFSSQHFFIYYT